MKESWSWRILSFILIISFTLVTQTRAAGSPPAAPNTHRLTAELWGPPGGQSMPGKKWLEMFTRQRIGYGMVIHIQKSHVPEQLVPKHFTGKPRGVRYDVLGTLAESELSKLGLVMDSIQHHHYHNPEDWMNAYTSELWVRGVLRPHSAYLKGTEWERKKDEKRAKKRKGEEAPRKRRLIKKPHKETAEGTQGGGSKIDSGHGTSKEPGPFTAPPQLSAGGLGVAKILTEMKAGRRLSPVARPREQERHGGGAGPSKLFGKR